MMQRYRDDLAIAALLLATAAASIGTGLLPGRTPLPLDMLGQFEPWAGDLPQPGNPLLGDPVMQIAHREFAAQAWRGGHLPLWNPSVMAGHPHVGDTLSQPFFPPMILLSLVFDYLGAFEVQVLLQFWFAGIFLYIWMRTLELGRISALAAALVWSLAGFQQVSMAYHYWMGTLMWIPAVAAAWEVARRPGSRRRSAWATALGGLAAGLVVVGGQLQFALFGALVLGIYCVGRALLSSGSETRRDVLVGASIAVIGVLVSAIHWLPAIDQARDTVRLAFDLDSLRSTGIPLSQLVTAVAPWALGDPRQGNYVGAQNANEMAVYIGLIPLLLVLATPFARRDRSTAVATAMALFVVLIATGTIAAAPLTLVPMVERFGLMRWLSMWPLAAAFLVALGLDSPARDPAAAGQLRVTVLGATVAVALLTAIALFYGDPKPTIRPVDALAFGAAASALVWWTFRPNSTARLAVVVLFLGADLLVRYHGYTPSAPLEQAFPNSTAISRMADERRAEPFRIATFQRDRIVLGPSVAPSVGLDEIGGYTSSGRSSYRDFVERLSDPPGIGALASNANMLSIGDANPLLLRMLNVRFVLADSQLPDVAREIIRRPPCEMTRPLAVGESIGRDIKVHAGGINRIDVRVIGLAPVAVHLLPRAGSEEHLAYAELESEGGAGASEHVSGTSDADVRPMYFEPIADSAGRTFHIRVDRPLNDSGPAPELCVDELGLVVDAWTTEPRYPLAFESDGVFVHRAPMPFGRAWLVPKARIVADQRAALLALGEATFDPLAEVIVESDEQLVSDSAVPDGSGVEGSDSDGGVADDRDGAGDRDGTVAAGNRIAAQGTSEGGQATGSSFGSVTVNDDGPNVRRVSFENVPSGWLVLSEAYAPGWRVSIDGRTAEVHRANGGLQAIAVPAGALTAVVWYRPTSFIVGLILTAIGLVVAGLVARWPSAIDKHL